MVVTIRYFKEDTEHPAIPPLGIYETISGKVEMIDAIFRQIVITDGSTKKTIQFDDLEEVSGAGIVSAKIATPAPSTRDLSATLPAF